MLTTPEILEAQAQPTRLGALLPRWLEEIPMYRGHASASTDSEPPLETYSRLPFIAKSDLRKGFPANFLRAGVELDDLLDQELIELEHTSGTSEERTALLLGLGWWAEQEARALRLNPFVARVLDEHPRARRVTINSPSCSGEICFTGVPSRSQRTVGDSLFISLSRLPFLWGEKDIDRMAAETLEWQPAFLDVDPVYGVALALHCERRGIRFPSLKFIIASYEFVSVNHRRVLERVFGVPVFNLYGSTETGHLLMETEAGLMRPSRETAYLELLKPAGTFSDGLDELVVTTLTNEFMPLLRYRIGDLVEKLELPYCDRYRVHGRVADAPCRPDGSRVSVLQIDECFRDLPGVAHYQLRSQPDGSFVLAYIKDNEGLADAAKVEVGRRLSAVLGSAQVSLEETDLLMPESSGKFRLHRPAS
jgi:phenylacetate-coenzyme A ligase PaaK-like adenylate-forming protein